MMRQILKRTQWSDGELELLSEACGRGDTYGDIAVVLQRSPAAVQLMAGRRGVSNNIALGGTKSIPRLSPISHRAMEIGNASELLVCADLILSGYRAFQASQGLPYDLVADIQGKLFRVGVKSVIQARTRPKREASRCCYQFQIKRSGRNSTQKSQRYTTDDVDLCALVAVDIRRVIYVPPRGNIFPTAFHVDAPNGAAPARARNGVFRKYWEQFSLDVAVRSILERTV